MMDDNNRWDKDFPEQWERVPLKSKFTFGKGLSIKKTDLTEQGENVISYGQIHAKWNSNVHCHNELLRHVPQTFCNGSDSSIAKRNGFIFADTSEDLDGVGNCAFIDSDKTIYAGYHTVLLTPIEDHDNKYLAYLFTTDTWRYQIRRHLTEVKVFSISQKTLKQTYIVLPPSDIQHAIASFLDRKCAAIDDSIAKHKAIIEKLEEYRKAEITRAVTKGLNPDAKMKDSGIPWVGEIPEGWEVCPLWTAFYNRKNKNTEGLEKNLLSLSYGRIIEKDIETKDGLLPANFNGYNIIEDGDIVLRMTDLQNDHKSLRTGLCTEHGIITSAYITLAPKETVDSRYFHYLLHSYDIEKVFYAMGEGIRQGMNYNEMKCMNIIVPTLSEQKEIADSLDSLSNSVTEGIDKHNQLIAKLQEYKKSLIYNAVTGKIDCREGA